MSYDALYNQIIMDYYRYPRNKGILEKPDFVSGVYNPLCGDHVTICGMFDSNKGIESCFFDAKGCVVSQATASLLVEYVIKKPIQEILLLNKNDIISLIKIELGPTRLRCALISLEALHNGLKKCV